MLQQLRDVFRPANEGFVATSVNLATRPTALLVLPLIVNFGLIVNAQVHFARHVLIYAPVICILAASLLDQVLSRLRHHSGFIRGVAVVCLVALAISLFANAFALTRHYSDDPRVQVARRIARNPQIPVTTTSFYTAIRGTRRITGPVPSSKRYLTCDIEFARYIGKKHVTEVFHAYGGEAALKFFNDLIAGRTAYRPIFVVRRKPRSLEDFVARAGLLPGLDTKFPDECILFERNDLA